MGQNVTSLNWYNYGKASFLKNGYQKNKGNLLSQLENANGKKIIAITGANAGIGKAMTKQLTERGHQVLMVCRNQERAQAARSEILEQIASTEVNNVSEPEIVIADCTNPEAIKNAISSLSVDHLDALVCNAGALFDKFSSNATGTHEFNLSVFVLHGAHLMTQLCLPLLRESKDPRVIFVSSGGMYRVGLNMKTLTEVTPATYDGTEAYCQCKRAQVIMAEKMAEKIQGVSFYSCHPGWALTPGVQSVKSLAQFVKWTGEENWRTPEEGALGISYLAAVDSSLLKNGEFYLDGEVAPKHLPRKWYSWAGSSTVCEKSVHEELWDYCQRENASILG